MTDQLERNLDDAAQNYNVEVALQLLNELGNRTENLSDVVAIAAKYLTDNNEQYHKKLFEGCLNVISKCTDNEFQEEILLQLLEEIEESKSVVKVICLLKPLEISLLKILKTSRNLNSLTWSFNSVLTYLDVINSEDAPQFDKVNVLFTEILLFYDNIFHDNRNSLKVDKLHLRRAFISFLFSLLYKFVLTNAYEDPIIKLIIKRIFVISNDIYSYFDYNDIIDGVIAPEVKHIGVLLYFVHVKKYLLANVPKVYDNLYLFQNSVKLINELLNSHVNGQICMGLDLMSTFIESISTKALPYHLVELPYQKMLFTNLEKLIVFNESETLRKHGLDIYSKYINSFDERGQYLLIYHLTTDVFHDGLNGHTITLFKNILVLKMQEFENNRTRNTYFCGQNLLSLIAKIKKLPHKDLLIQHSDRVIAVLNLMRFLLLRDRNCEYLQTREHIHTWCSSYFKPLLEMIQYAKDECYKKIKDLNKMDKGDAENSKIDSATIIKHEEETVKLGITALEVMESICLRLMEIVDANNS